MTKRQTSKNPLLPSKSETQWTAQGWATEPRELTAAPRLEATISIRLDPDAAEMVGRAARLKGWTKSEFVRTASVAEAKKICEAQPVPLVVKGISTDHSPVTTGSSHSIDRLPDRQEQREMVTSGPTFKPTITIET